MIPKDKIYKLLQYACISAIYMNQNLNIHVSASVKTATRILQTRKY